ncbi:sec-independent protein translocase protein TatA [Kitasatospora sp. MAA4]|uniref:Sec-independent protein translocase subunit TatA n=1 Tax=Kitasatospora sp. MAA4 TaxID=3035093 RepID=UPI0024764C8B|nr:Sec-independent protein translocase subunit TatA [Kitasatospora sp. MAA4]MDH6130871.1 sec-independent protein translocase protein TatA [Kitasatospora sp. MAA4]
MGRIVEFLLIAAMVTVLFGAKRLPQLARSLGESLRILKSETRALRDESGERIAKAPRAAAETVRTIQAAPGDASTARPVTEQRPGRPH